MGYFSKSFILDTTFVTQPYHINGEGGYNYNHWGIDLVCWNGSYTCLGWIMAHSDGVVEAVRNDCQGYEAGSYGNYVLIRHANNYRTLYAHGAPGTVEVYPGQSVKRGTPIMFMGNTGESYGGHVHIEIRRPDGYKINPEPFLAADLPGSAYLDIDGLGGPKTVARMQKVLAVDWKYVANDEPGVIGQAQIVVGAEVKGLAAVLQLDTGALGRCDISFSLVKAGLVDGLELGTQMLLKFSVHSYLFYAFKFSDFILKIYVKCNKFARIKSKV